MQRAYLDGLEAEELLSTEGDSSEMPAGFEPTRRTVDTGQETFDIGGMITDLEAERDKRRKAGGG